jgi:hypothetical protein
MAKGEAAKRPAFQFYPKEWVWDLELRQCSIAARGLWADLLCLMHEGIPYGRLSAPVNLILRVTGLTEPEYLSLLADLETHGVFSREEDGTIYSRRMVRDEHRRITNKTNGEGGGNPALVNRGVIRPNADTRITGQEEKRREDIKTSKKEASDENCDIFRELYPAHRLDNYGAQCFISSEDQAGILERLRLAVKSEDWTRENGRYVPKASKWVLDGTPAPAAQPTPAPKPWKADW